MNDSESKIELELLKKGDQKILEKIYNDNRAKFINFSKKYDLALDDILDIYQDSIIALRDNAIENKITELTSSLSTYLFAIGKYKIYQVLRRQKKLVSEDLINDFKNNTEINVNLSNQQLTKQQELLLKSFKRLGNRCSEILTLFYYEGFTLDEIMVILKYSNKNVLKSQKSRCMKQLKDWIREKK